jgi:hypothetical protein
MRKLQQVCIWALGLGFLASAALAGSREMALGADGEVYAVRTGTYGDLFANVEASERANPVLALEISKPGFPLKRILVPTTGGPEIETSPSVLYEEDSETAFLLWESDFGFHPILQLAGFDGATWSRPIEVIGNPFALKTSVQFTITRDVYEETADDGAAVSRHSTILHVTWQEETADGGLATLYSPIVINDGKYLGWNPIFNLDEYLQDRVTAASTAVQPSLARAPLVESGRDERTVVIAYASTALGRLTSIEVDALPQQLVQLADKARSHIIDLGHKYYPSDLPGLADKARSHIIDLGHAFRPDIVQAIAKQVETDILAGDTNGLEPLANKARSHIIDLGAQLSGRGLRGAKGADATAKLVEIEEDPTILPEASESFLFQFRVVSDLPIPQVGAGDVRLFVSEGGEDLTVSWAQADKVLYRNGRDDRWTDPRELRLTKDFDLAKAYEILNQRLGKR